MPNLAKLKTRHGRAIVIGSLAALLFFPPAFAAPLPRGRVLFLMCASCHDISDAASQKTGPNLRGVVGRKAGALPGFGYSAAMKAQSFVWDEAKLDSWLTAPNALVPGTAMAFQGLPAKSDRDAVIAYLISQGG